MSTTSSIITAAGFVGDITGNVTGNVTGNITGNVTGEVTALGSAETAEYGAGAIGTGGINRLYRYNLPNGDICTEIQLDITGLTSKNTANDIIGLATGGAAYITRNVVATNGVIYRVEMKCLETPAGGDDDINLVAGSAATDAYDGAVTGAAVILNAGDWTVGMQVVSDVPKITANYYLYLTAGTGDKAAAYTAGQYIIRLYGHAALS